MKALITSYSDCRIAIGVDRDDQFRLFSTKNAYVSSESHQFISDAIDQLIDMSMFTMEEAGHRASLQAKYYRDALWLYKHILLGDV